MTTGRRLTTARRRRSTGPLAPRPPVFLLLLLAVLLLAPACAAYQSLRDGSLRRIPGGGGDLTTKGSLLAPLLSPRVPGTAGSRAAQRHLAGFFAAALPAWRLERHESAARVPGEAGEVPFVNLVFTRDPPWAAPGDVARLALVAHYDSMRLPEGFVGATDSAAPCAMLLHVARSVDTALTAKWAAMEAAGEAGLGLEEEKGVQIIFLDGEEAWKTWSDADSLYGARALAEKWDSERHPASSNFRTPLESISLFVLLDLLGTADPNVPSYFASTHWAYQGMASIERRMRKLKLLSSTPKRYFLPESGRQNFPGAFVQDDHVPFMMRGVEILHVIPTPFPLVWHTMDDNGDCLDPATVDDWSKIVTAFAAGWLELDEFIPSNSTSDEDEHTVRDRSEL